MVANKNNNNNVRKCYTHYMEYTAEYTSEGEARWEGELMYADWKNHWPDYWVELQISKLDNGNWRIVLTAEKGECNIAEH